MESKEQPRENVRPRKSRNRFELPKNTMNTSVVRPLSVKVQVVSDIHLSMKRKMYYIEPAADYLLICGDIETYFIGFFYLEKFLKYHAPLFKKIIWTVGNHELMVFGMKTVYGVADKCCKIAKKTDTIFLYNASYEIEPGLVVIGTPLFTHFPSPPDDSKNPPSNSLGGYLRLVHVKGPVASHKVSRDDVNELHEKAKKAIVRALEMCKEQQKTAIIITHFGPLAPYNSPSKRRNQFRANWARKFYNTDEDMEEVLDAGKGTIGLWAFGHDHMNHSFVYRYPDGESFDIVSNQVGNSSEPHVEARYRPNYSYEVKVKQLEEKP